MSTHIDSIASPYLPQLPAEQLVEEVNRIYHQVESNDYDQRHPEIRDQLPTLWSEMLAVSATVLHGPLCVLDLGCGTGFEAEQMLRAVPAGNITRLTCFDPSPEMLARCRARIAPRISGVDFVSRLEDVVRTEKFNLLLTNSVLHHMPDPFSAISGLLPMLSPDAVWIAGHEPSERYYRNPECMRAFESYTRSRRWGKYLDPFSYWRRIGKLVGIASDPARDTAKRAYKSGLFGKRPPPSVIARLVDLHVPRGCEDDDSFVGLSLDLASERLAAAWSLLWSKTYAFMGPVYEGGLSPRWQRIARELSERHPRDGANFSAVWRRHDARRGPVS